MHYTFFIVRYCLARVFYYWSKRYVSTYSMLSILCLYTQNRFSLIPLDLISKFLSSSEEVLPFFVLFNKVQTDLHLKYVCNNSKLPKKSAGYA